MYPTQHPAAGALGAEVLTEQELSHLMREASANAAAARARGDTEEYEFWKERVYLIGRIWSGVGDTRDLLEQEQERKTMVQQFLEPVSGMMQSVALGAAVILGFMFLTRGK